MQAVLVNCSLKPPTQESNTERLAEVVLDELEQAGVTTQRFRCSAMTLDHGVETEMSAEDEWPRIHDAILEAEILLVATPTWVGRPSSYAQQVLERMDAMVSETDDAGNPVAWGKVAGVVVTGNEDGAHHVISEVAGALVDIGFTIPGQAWTYWNRGPGPGPEFGDTDEGHEWAEQTGRTAAQHLVQVARALQSGPAS